MTMTVIMAISSFRGVTKQISTKFTASSSNRSRCLGTSLKMASRWKSMSPSQQLVKKEIRNDEIGLFSSPESSIIGLAALVAGCFALVEYRDRDKLQYLLLNKSSCLSLTSLEKVFPETTTKYASSPSNFAQSKDFPENYTVSVRAVKGGRLSMEDEYDINNGGRFVAVFDGHGGGGVSTFLRDTLYAKVAKHLTAYQKETNHNKAARSEADASNPVYSTRCSSISDIVKSIRAAYTEAGNEVLQMDEFQYQGSTALAVWLHEDIKSNKRTLVSANLGDSRAIMSRNGQAIDVTRDHKPSDEIEKKRILSMGEELEWDDYCQIYRVRSLSLSRAIGDRFAKPAISDEVEIQLIPLSESTGSTEGNDEFIVLASDGLWDVMTSQDCVNFIHERFNEFPKAMNDVTPLEMQRLQHARRKTMSRFVTDEALKRGSGDNICVVIVWLNQQENT